MFARELEEFLSVHPIDRGEEIEKLLERKTVVKIIQQRLDGNSGAAKNQRSTHNVGIGLDGAVRQGNHKFNLSGTRPMAILHVQRQGVTLAHC
jgi:hypothetical protein